MAHEADGRKQVSERELQRQLRQLQLHRHIYKDNRQPDNRLVRRLRASLTSGILGLTSSLLLGSLSWGAAPARAADRLNLSYPSLPNLEISVDDFEAFARDGTLGSTLAPFALLATPQQLAELKRLLRERFKLTPTLVNQFASTQSGQVFFRRLGEILKTPNNQNGSKALHQAFLAAAADPEGVSLISLMRRFPHQTINVDGKSGFDAVSAAVKVFSEQSAIIASLEQTATTTPAVEVPSQPDLRQMGTSQWQMQTLTYRNPNRMAGMQTLTADVYLPIRSSKPAPLIIISHGVASNRTTFAYLATHLASHGFAVAAVQHPGSDSERLEQFMAGQLGNNSAIVANEIANRPLDVKLLIDAIQTRVATQATWKGRVNPQQVGVLGQSLGGYTALATGGATLNIPELQQECPKVLNGPLSFNLSLPLQCNVLQIRSPQTNFRDPRVKAVLALNPLTSLFFGEAGMRQVQVPTMIVAGSDDIFAPPLDEQIMPFSWLPAKDRYLLTLRKGTHFSFISVATGQGVFPVPKELVGPDPKAAQPAIRSVSTAFFTYYLLGQTQYAPFLTQSYVQTLVPEPFSLNMLTSVTPEQLQELLASPRASRPQGQ
jgi:predicted dienelactone hydrolase